MQQPDHRPAIPEKKVILVSHPGIGQNTLCSMLESLPYVSVVCAAGALTAYDLLKREAFDVVLIDSNLVLAETLALISHIKHDPIETRCIVLTVLTRNHPELYAAGANVILYENISPLQLEKAICQVIERKRAC